MTKPTYSHHQRALWLWFVAGGLVLGLGRWTFHTEKAHFPILISISIFAAILAFLFAGLRVQVTQEKVKLSFGVGLINKTILRTQICHAVIVRNSWWYGWGIRLTPHGWMWNISGLSAVQLTYQDGKSFRIGTNDPEGLLAALLPQEE
tara:strand:- start:483 stop:926 length:444 start_codon:yes stop_codon:yes gene_type:complete